MEKEEIRNLFFKKVKEINDLVNKENGEDEYVEYLELIDYGKFIEFKIDWSYTSIYVVVKIELNGGLFENVEGIYLDNEELSFVNKRNGYFDETFFTISYDKIRDIEIIDIYEK